MVGRAVENKQDILPGEPACQHLEEGLEACRIRGRHDQVDASAVLGRNRAVEIDVLADELRGDCGPRAERRPAGPDAVHAAEACFIGKHDAQPPPTPSGGPSCLPYSIRKAAFLKAICATRSRLG